MRSRKEIKDRLRQLKFYHYKKWMESKLISSPENCLHQRKVGDSIGLCNRATDTGFRVCDSRRPETQKQPSHCGCFELRHTKESLARDWDLLMDQERSVLVASGCGDVASLLWVLDDPEPLVWSPTVYPCYLLDSPLVQVSWGEE